MSAAKRKIDLTTGPALKKVLILSWPLVVSNLMSVFYNVADTAWLGMLGKEEVAAMAFVFPVIFLVVSIGIGIGVAGSIFVAQYEGAGNGRMVNFSAGQTLFFAFFLSLLITVLGYVAGGPLVKLLGASPEVAGLADQYLKVIFSGVVFMFYFFIFNALMRGWGNTYTPMKIMLFANLLNIGLDPLLIFGAGFIPAMGIKGAALSTVFSRVTAAAIAMNILFRGTHALKITFSDLKPDGKTLGRLFRLGWPATMEHAMRSIGFMGLTAIVATFGTVYVAAYSIGTRVFSFIIMPSLALSMGVATGVGQNLGAGLKARAKKITAESAIAVFLILIGVGILMFTFSRQIVSLFIKDQNVRVISAGSAFLRRLAVIAPLVGAAITIRGGFKGAGRTLQSMLQGMAALWVVRVPAAYVLGILTGSPAGIWNAFIIGGVAELLFSAIYYFKGDWMRTVIKKEYKNVEFAEVPQELDRI